MDDRDFQTHAFAGELSEAESTALRERVNRERRRLKLADVENLDEALRAVLQQKADRLRAEEIAGRRATMLDCRRMSEALDFVLNEFGDRPLEGLNALISGSTSAHAGARDSVEARQNTRVDHAVGGFAADIEALGFTGLFNADALEKSIAQALWSLDTPDATFDGPPEALEIATIMRKRQDKLLDAATTAGAWVDRRSDAFVRWSHDPAAVRTAGFEAWRAAILPALDLDKTLDPDGPARRGLDAELAATDSRLREVNDAVIDLEAHLRLVGEAPRGELDLLAPKGNPAEGMLRPSKALGDTSALDMAIQDWLAAELQECRDTLLELHAEREALTPRARDLTDAAACFRPGRGDVDDFLYYVWKRLSAGEHLRYGPRSGDRGGRKKALLGAAAKNFSPELALVFADADGWMRYNKRFGAGSLREAFLRGLEHQARATALLEVLGPSGAAGWEALIRYLTRHHAEIGQGAFFDGPHAWEGGALRDRVKEVDGSLHLAGNDVLNAARRTARAMEGMARLNGALIDCFADMPLLDGAFAPHEQMFFHPLLEGLGELISGKPAPEQLALLSELDVALEGMSASLAGKFAEDEQPGRTSRLLRASFKLNRLSWWTDAWRSSAAMMLSHGLAVRRDMDFAELPPELSHGLGICGIDRGRWNILRNMHVPVLNGKGFMTPEGVRLLPREVFDASFSEREITPTNADIRALRSELETQLRTYFRDRVDDATVPSNSQAGATPRRNTGVEAVPGEALRFFARFQAFPTDGPPEAPGRNLDEPEAGAVRFSTSLAAGNGELRGMARLVLMTTLFGYGSLAIKRLLQGKEPRLLDAADRQAVMTAAMLQGGALGLYADFLFAEMRPGRGGNTAPLGGSALSNLEAFHDVADKVKEGNGIAAAGLRFALTHMPGNNLFYVRPVFDYTVGHELFEMISPGYMQRTLERVEEKYGRRFWLMPAQAAGV